MFRRFDLTERYKVEFRMEAFNFTNTPHLGNPGTVSNFNPTVTDPLRRFGGYAEITGIANTGPASTSASSVSDSGRVSESRPLSPPGRTPRRPFQSTRISGLPGRVTF